MEVNLKRNQTGGSGIISAVKKEKFSEVKTILNTPQSVTMLVLHRIRASVTVKLLLYDGYGSCSCSGQGCFYTFQARFKMQVSAFSRITIK